MLPSLWKWRLSHCVTSHQLIFINYFALKFHIGRIVIPEANKQLYKEFYSNVNNNKNLRGCIQKFPDWVDNEINDNNKHSLRSNTKCYGGKIH